MTVLQKRLEAQRFFCHKGRGSGYRKGSCWDGIHLVCDIEIYRICSLTMGLLILVHCPIIYYIHIISTHVGHVACCFLGNVVIN